MAANPQAQGHERSLSELMPAVPEGLAVWRVRRQLQSAEPLAEALEYAGFGCGGGGAGDGLTGR